MTLYILINEKCSIIGLLTFNNTLNEFSKETKLNKLQLIAS